AGQVRDARLGRARGGSASSQGAARTAVASRAATARSRRTFRLQDLRPQADRNACCRVRPANPVENPFLREKCAHDRGMTPSLTATPEIIKCRTTADFLAALPLLVGFTATNSIFIVLFSGKAAGRTIRLDLPP